MIMYFYSVYLAKNIKSNPECLPGSMECIGQVLYMCDINNSWTSTLCPDNTKCTVKGNQITCEETDSSSLLGDPKSKDDSIHNHGKHSDKNRGDKYFILGEEGQELDNVSKDKPREKNKNGKKNEKVPKDSIEEDEEKNEKYHEKSESKDYPKEKKKNKKDETDIDFKHKKKKKSDENVLNDQNLEDKEENSKKDKEKSKSKNTIKNDSIIHSGDDFNEIIANIPEKLKQMEKSLNKKGMEEKQASEKKDEDGEHKNEIPEKLLKSDTKNKENEEEDMIKVVQTILIKDSSNFLNNSGDSPIPLKSHADLKKIIIKKISDPQSLKNKVSGGDSISKTTASNIVPEQNTGTSSVPSNDSKIQNNVLPSPQPSSPLTSTPNSQLTATSPSSGAPKNSSASTPASNSKLAASSTTANNSQSNTPGSPPNTGNNKQSTSSDPPKPPGSTQSSSALPGESEDTSKPPTSSGAAAPSNTPPTNAGGAGDAANSKNKPSNTPSSQSSGGGDAGKFTKEKIMEIVQKCKFQANPQYADAVAAGIGKIDEKHRSMFLAQIIHESAGLSAIEELACKEGGGCANQYKDNVGLEGKDYHGRGFIQLTWGANYKEASAGLNLGDKLLTNPEIVSEDPNMAMDTSVWFWNARVAKDPGVQQNKFGATTNVINGVIECKGDDTETYKKRYGIYKTVAESVGETDLASEEGCRGGGGSSTPASNPQPGAQPGAQPGGNPGGSPPPA